MNIGMEMEQLPWGLYLIVREYSPSLSDKQTLAKPQPANLNSRCLQEVVGSVAVGAAPLAVRVGFSLHRLAAGLALRALLFFLQIPGCLRAWFGSLG